MTIVPRRRWLAGFAVLALAGCGAQTGGSEWRVILEGDGAQISVSPARVVPLGDGKYRVWLRDSLHEPQVDADGRRYHAFVSQAEFDCGRRLARGIVGLIPETMLDEEHNHAPFVLDEPWKPVTADTRTEQELTAFCAWAAENGA